MRKRFRISAICLLVAASGAMACPMCVEALAGESNNAGNLPLGFYYSILFMLSMPFLIVTGFALYFYALSRGEANRVLGETAQRETAKRLDSSTTLAATTA